MTGYPEHDKLAAIQEHTQVIGEFLEWLASQGVQLMTWREDLTDSRPTDPECPHRWRDCDGCTHTHDDCAPASGDETTYGLLAYSIAHCKHWQDPERKAGGNARQGVCCRCHRGRFYEVTGIRSWVHERRSTTQLLADWAGIDLGKIEAEKRQMLDSIRAAQEAAGSRG